MEDQELSEMLQAQQAALAELKSDPEVIRRFRSAKSSMIIRDMDSRESTNATCTAFCLYYLSSALLLPRAGIRGELHVLTREEAIGTNSCLGIELARQHSSIGRREKKRKKERTSTGLLPNPYNSAIQVAGYLASSRYLEIVTPTDIQRKCRAIVRWLAWRYLRGHKKGWVSRIESDAPSAYLTFWTAAALREWTMHPACREKRALDEILTSVSKWGEQELTNSIAYHYAGFRSRVDVVEITYAVMCCMTFGSTSAAAELARQAISILFTSYFDHGCFSPSAPVLADQHNFSLQCPTSEIAALLINLHPELLTEQWRSLHAIFTWLSLNRIHGSGWVPESLGRYGQPTAFMTTSAVAFLAGLSTVLDNAMHEGACNALNVVRTPPSPPKKYEYPGDLGRILRSHVLSPLKSDPRKEDLASYSMILYGPPGTSKTTISRKLAADLGWPLLVINQNAFLQKGVANIDAEAERVFRLVGYLKDVVVLFDEVEELVEERSKSDKVSRILTTSMLPRIHYLRDRHRIVFIFATNRLESIDNAAARLGRFDIVKGVLPPSPEERKEILESILASLDAGEDVSSAFEQARIAKTADNFCYVDLYALVRHVKIAKEIERQAITVDFVEETKRIYERRVAHTDFLESVAKVKENSKQVDRP